jgi:hypothetical protein
MGQIGDILVAAAPFAVDPGDVHEEPAPPVLAQRTRSVSLDLGLDILGGLLQGLGVPKVGLGSAFAPESTISFNFHDVHRVLVEPNRLGRRLQDCTIDRVNPATALYFEERDPWRLLLIDSVLTSPGFTVTASRSRTQSVHVDLPTLQQLVSNVSAKVNVSSAASSEVSFTGDERLSFAFTCLEVTLDTDARVVGLAGRGRKTTIQGLTDPPAASGASPNLTGVLLSDDPAMLDLDAGTGP